MSVERRTPNEAFLDRFVEALKSFPSINESTRKKYRDRYSEIPLSNYNATYFATAVYTLQTYPEITSEVIDYVTLNFINPAFLKTVSKSESTSASEKQKQTEALLKRRKLELSIYIQLLNNINQALNEANPQ